jgi:hypothetical protein
MTKSRLKTRTNKVIKTPTRKPKRMAGSAIKEIMTNPINPASMPRSKSVQQLDAQQAAHDASQVR